MSGGPSRPETKTTNFPSGDIIALLSSPGKSVKRVKTGSAKGSVTGSGFFDVNQTAATPAIRMRKAAHTHDFDFAGAGAAAAVATARDAELPGVAIVR